MDLFLERANPWQLRFWKSTDPLLRSRLVTSKTFKAESKILGGPSEKMMTNLEESSLEIEMILEPPKFLMDFLATEIPSFPISSWVRIPKKDFATKTSNDVTSSLSSLMTSAITSMVVTATRSCSLQMKPRSVNPENESDDQST